MKYCTRCMEECTNRWFITCLNFISYLKTDLPLSFHQVVISSIMCGYNKEDWTELAKMAEVKKANKN